jgi:ubiquinone/menaquinone biosynthesis C-methylase UbiE
MVALERVEQSVASAYDAAATAYNAWHWSAFWDDHEVPAARALAAAAPSGLFVDAGCGTGRYRTVARALRRPYLGLDISSQMLAVGAAHLGMSVPGDQLVNADIRATGLPDAAAAIVLCARALCHVPDIAAGFGEFARVTKRGGSLILCDLHPTFRVPVTRLPTAAGKIDVPTFRRSPERLVDIAAGVGFRCAKRFDMDAGDGDSFFLLHLVRG